MSTLNDRFESFLVDQQPALDVDFDEERAWMGITGKLQRRRNRQRRVLALAASLTVLLSVGAWIFFIHLPGRSDGQVEAFLSQSNPDGVKGGAAAGAGAEGNFFKKLLSRTGASDPGFTEDFHGLVSGEFGSEARIFSFAVEQKLAEVQKTGADPAALRELSEQLALVDRNQARYMADLKVVGPDPRILKGIIRCYEQKIRIIEKTLNRIERGNRSEPGPAQRII
jgi:hypothetical protein